LNNTGGGTTDNLACTSDDCVNGAAVHNAVNTNDNNPCTTDGCAEPGGVFHTNLNNVGGGTTDNLVCTSDDCVNGATVHNAVNTNDNNPCTTRSEERRVGKEYRPSPEVDDENYN